MSADRYQYQYHGSEGNGRSRDQHQYPEAHHRRDAGRHEESFRRSRRGRSPFPLPRRHSISSRSYNGSGAPSSRQGTGVVKRSTPIHGYNRSGSGSTGMARWLRPIERQLSPIRTSERARAARHSAVASTRVLFSNLDYGVSTRDIRELCGAYWPVQDASVHYDRDGRSKGFASVLFDRNADAHSAVRKYDNVELDGRPMKVRVLNDSAVAFSRDRTNTQARPLPFDWNRLGVTMPHDSGPSHQPRSSSRGTSRGGRGFERGRGQSGRGFERGRGQGGRGFERGRGQGGRGFERGRGQGGRGFERGRGSSEVDAHGSNQPRLLLTSAGLRRAALRSSDRGMNERAGYHQQHYRHDREQFHSNGHSRGASGRNSVAHRPTMTHHIQSPRPGQQQIQSASPSVQSLDADLDRYQEERERILEEANKQSANLNLQPDVDEFDNAMHETGSEQATNSSSDISLKSFPC